MSGCAALRWHRIAVVLMLPLLCCGPGNAVAGEINFATNVGDLGNQEHYSDRRPHERVGISLPGTLYAPPIAVKAVANKDVDRTTLLGAVASDFSAWRSDDVEWIVSNFVPEERNGLRAFLANEDLRKANRAVFSQDRSAEVWGIVNYKEYGLVLFTYDNNRRFGAVATFRKMSGEWKRTNTLSGDRVFDVVWSAFRSGDVTKK